MTELERKIGYAFRDPSLLARALTTPACRMDHPEGGDNQRLEFLGDAILDFIVGEEMYKRKSDWNEGKLSKTRALVVCEKTLAKEAEKLEVGSLLFLGKGEEGTGGRDKISTLADTMESLFAAIYLDGGFEAAKKVVLSCLEPYIDQALRGELIFDYKSRLLEKAQTKHETHQVLFDVVNEDTIEIWLKYNDAPTVLYLFDYEEGIVPYHG